MSQPEPEVDRFIPAYYGKRYVLAYSENPRLYYLFDVRKLDAPVMTSEDREAVRAAFDAKEPGGGFQALVRCPSCRSRWVWKLSGGKRKKTAKSFRCAQCTYTW